MLDSGLLNEVIAAFDHATATWSVTFLPIALNLFRGLSLLEFTWTFWVLLISQRASAEVVFEVLLRKVVFFGFLLFLIERSPVLISTIISSFQVAGGSASGITALHPSGFLTTGGYISMLVLAQLDAAGLLTDPLGTLVGVFGSFGIMVCFGLMAAAITIALVEIMLCAGATMLLLGMAASRWTYSLAEGALSTVVRKGVGLLITYLLASVIDGLTIQWATRLASAEAVSPFELLTFLATSLVCAILLWSGPRLASQLVPAHINFGLNPHVQPS